MILLSIKIVYYFILLLSGDYYYKDYYYEDYYYEDYYYDDYYYEEGYFSSLLD